MKRNTLNMSAARALGAMLALAMVVGTVRTSQAGFAARVAAGPAGVNVWVEGGDVFPDYRGVSIWLRADRDCYTTLFLVDTDGYIHVLYPYANADDGWVMGGRSYCYRACDLGLDRLDGSGIAYVFAVGSPVPFDYSCYGDGVFVGRYGYRVVGDPFVACRDFYVSLLPAGCRWDFVGVGYARFYVRQWVRYPSYLCYGGPGVHVRVGDACGLCNDVYGSYRSHVAAPYDVFRPTAKFKQTYADREGHSRVQSVRTIERTRALGAPVVARRGDGADFDRTRVAVRGTAFKDSGRGANVRVVSTSRAREFETRGKSVSSARVAQHRPVSAIRTADRASVQRPAKVTASGSRGKGSAKKARQAE